MQQQQEGVILAEHPVPVPVATVPPTVPVPIINNTTWSVHYFIHFFQVASATGSQDTGAGDLKEQVHLYLRIYM